MSAYTRTKFPLIALPVVAPCGGGDSAGDGFTRSDSAGVEIARPSTGTRPFGRVSATAVGGDRLYYSDADHFTIEVYDGASRLRRLIRLPAREAAAIDQDRWREVYEPGLAALEGESNREVERRHRFESADLPEREPAHGSGMAVSDHGRLWVERYAHPLSGRTPAWDVFDERGRWLGAVLPPADLTIHQVGPWGILAGWRDDLGVEYVGLWGDH